MENFAIIETGGKQYRVSSGQKLRIEKLDAKDGAIIFDKVLLRATDGKIEIGTPYIAGARVAADALRTVRERKKIIMKYHSKTRERRKKGHRQEHTEVVIK